MISVMMSYSTGARMIVGEMMGSLVGSNMDDSYCRDRASALMFREPGAPFCLSVIKSFGRLKIFQVTTIC